MNPILQFVIWISVVGIIIFAVAKVKGKGEEEFEQWFLQVMDHAQTQGLSEIQAGSIQESDFYHLWADGKTPEEAYEIVKSQSKICEDC